MLVSIITPCYNAARFIGETIESVLSQTYQEWEMLIVDDCSKDNSIEVVKAYEQQDERIRLIALTENAGAAEARNIALRQAKGRYIAFLDSDDLWVPEKLEKQLGFMQKNDLAFTFGAYERMTEDGKQLINFIPAPKVIDYKGYLKNTIIGCLTVMIDKQKTGDFEMPLIKSSHDMALWLLLMKRGVKAYGIQETLGFYREVTTSNTAKKYKAALDVWKVYREVEKLNLVYSAYNFIGYAVNAVLKRMQKKAV